MSLVSQLFLLTAIRHLATDGLEEVPLTVANLNSERKKKKKHLQSGPSSFFFSAPPPSFQEYTDDHLLATFL